MRKPSTAVGEEWDLSTLDELATTTNYNTKALQILQLNLAPSPPPAGCKRGACPFSYTNPRNVNGGRCGEVDASSRMPGDIWGYPTAVQRYVDATLKCVIWRGMASAGGAAGCVGLNVHGAALM